MDALFSIDRSTFRQAANHIALFHRPASPTYEQLAQGAIAAAGRRVGSFKTWDVPQLSTVLTRAVPIDVHGGYILVDEEALQKAGVSYGVQKYQIITGCLRDSAGGRLWYDFKTMNTSLLMGGVAGAAFLHLGRQRWHWMRTRPYLRVAAATAVGIMSTYASKLLFRGLSMGAFAAQRNFSTAADCLACDVCLDEVQKYTKQQAFEVDHYKMPKTPTGGDLPPEMQALIRKGNEVNSFVLNQNVQMLKRTQQKYKDKRCDHHKDVAKIDYAQLDAEEGSSKEAGSDKAAGPKA